MFAKETEEERQYKEKMDTVLDISMKEAMIQVQKRSTPALKQKVFCGSVPSD
jgi:hypothetical protein